MEIKYIKGVEIFRINTINQNKFHFSIIIIKVNMKNH